MQVSISNDKVIAAMLKLKQLKLAQIQAMLSFWYNFVHL